MGILSPPPEQRGILVLPAALWQLGEKGVHTGGVTGG